MSIYYSSEEMYQMFVNGDYDKEKYQDRGKYSDKRIMRDLVELNRNLKDLDTVIAYPLRNNIYCWHVNMLGSGKYKHAVFHLRIIFTTSYPLRPPRVEMLTNLPNHDHVYGKWICVDLLQTHSNYGLSEVERKYTGWNSSYSVISILKNLQIFFFSEEHSGEKIQLDDEQVRISRKVVLESLRYGCKECGHKMKASKPWPWKKEWKMPKENEVAAYYDTLLKRKKLRMISEKFLMRKESALRKRNLMIKDEKKKMEESRKTKKIKRNGVYSKYQLPKPIYPLSINSLKNVPTDILSLIFSFFGKNRSRKKKRKKKRMNENDITIQHVRSTCRRFGCIIDQPLSLPQSVICAHSKQEYDEDIIGYGLVCKRKRKGTPGMINSPSYDFISLESFEHEKIRLDSTKNPFTYFFPLYLSPKYGRKASKYFKKTVMMIMKPPEPPKKKLLNSEREALEEKLKKMSQSDFERERMEKERAENERWRTDHLQTDLFGYSFSDVPKAYFSDMKFSIEMGLTVVTKMMKSLVVTIMNQSIHASMKALDAYLHVYRWYVALALEKLPNEKEEEEEEGEGEENDKKTGLYLDMINMKVRQFIEEPYSRHKRVTPDLGDFLALSSLATEFSYKDIMLPVVEETLTRNVLWIIKRYKDYGNIIYSKSDRVGKEEMIQAWDASQVGLKLLCFNAFFLRVLKSGSLHEIQAQVRSMDRRGGFAEDQLKLKLQQTIFSIQKNMNNYRNFFLYIYLGMKNRGGDVDLEPPTMKMVGKWLKKAVFCSIQFRYHRHKYVKGRKICRDVNIGKKLTMMSVGEIEKNYAPDDFSLVRRKGKKRGCDKKKDGETLEKNNNKDVNHHHRQQQRFGHDPNYRVFTKTVYNRTTTDAGTTVIKIEKKRVRVRKGRRITAKGQNGVLFSSSNSKKNSKKKTNKNYNGNNRGKKKMKKSGKSDGGSNKRVFKCYDQERRRRKFGDPQYQVFVAGIPYDSEIDDIHKLFSVCGNVININHLVEKGVCFVEFSSEDEQLIAIQRFNEEIFNGRMIYVRKVTYDENKKN